MPEVVRSTVIALLVGFLGTAAYYRIQSQRSREPLDRTKEGWAMLIGARLCGLFTFVAILGCVWKPPWFPWALYQIPVVVRWLGVLALACSVLWLIWMFHTLGRNLTDTVVTRRDAHFVNHGPYQFVRNPMYTGILLLGISLGLALGTWLVPAAASFIFTLLAIRTRTEEKFLLERFGQQYRSYMQRVGRFFPKMPG